MMNTVFHSLLMVLAGATQKELTRQVKYFKTKKEVLRTRLPRHVLMREYLTHYHTERPHRVRGNDLLNVERKQGRPRTDHGKIEERLVPRREVRSKQMLGGLLKSYRRAV